MEIKGHAAVVTGGGSGLGAETARFLSARGAKVALLDLDPKAASEVAREVDGVAVACDVSNASSVESAVAEAREAHGPARFCISCAGIAPAKRVLGRDGPMPLDEFIHVVNVNLIGTFNVARIVASDMAGLEPVNETGERGVIVCTASVAAFEGQIGQAAYSASKGGVVSMTLPIAREFARLGVRVVTIAPGLMGTPMMLGFSKEVQDRLAAQVPFPSRLGRPDEYAALVGHIIENAMLNGNVIRLDGAIRMQPK
jgi:NAD(P)-dependent dehydrogenase (short-subunit alcohol dehydrogenase family)